MTILVTGFDPFGGESINPAIEAVKRLPDTVAGATVIKEMLPTVFKTSGEVLRGLIEQHAPDVVICVGQAGGRSHITVERVAINVDDARIADNSGEAPIDEAIVAEGPAAYMTTLPLKAMVAHMKDQGVPASVSNSAGTFVCNHIMYVALHEAQLAEKPFKAGFIHIPFLPDQVLERAGVASMPLETIVKGLTHAVEAAVQTKEDIKTTGGTIC